MATTRFARSATTRFARTATTCFARTFKALVSPLATAIGCSNVYPSCRSRLQACHASVPEAPPTPAWHMCRPSDLKVHSSDPSTTIPNSNPARQSRIWKRPTCLISYEVMHVPLPETRFSDNSGDIRTAEPAPPDHVDTTVSQPFHR
jgi:hypothetical protein